ncbi:hypothetical protein Tco_1221046 [Tanacetum coccineum]
MTYPPIRLEGLPSELERDLLPMTPRNLRIVSSGVKSSLRWLLVIKGLAVQSPPLYSLITIEAWSCQILHNQWLHPSHDNTPLTNRTSTSANPDPVIIPAFVEANYEVLKSLLRDRRRQVRNEDLRTELDYYNKEYDDDREMKPRPPRVRETTPFLRTGSPRAQRHKGRVVLSMAWQFNHHPHTFRSPSKPGRAKYCTIFEPLSLSFDFVFSFEIFKSVLVVDELNRESRKLPTVELFDIESGRISNLYCETLNSITLNVLTRLQG